MRYANRKIGEILIAEGYIDEERLASYLMSSKNSNLKLGELLVKEGVVNAEVITDLLSKQNEIQRYSKEEFPIIHGLSEYLDISMAKKYHVVPLAIKNGVLKLATTDPLKFLLALDAIETMLNCEVEPVICTQDEFEYIFDLSYLSDPKSVLEEPSVETIEKGEDSAKDLKIASLKNMADDAPIVKLVNAMLGDAIKKNASDIHISPEKNRINVKFRIDGKLRLIQTIAKSSLPAIVSRLKILADLDISITRIPQDGRFSIKTGNMEINVRMSTIPTIYGENVVLRLLNTSSGVITLYDLGMDEKDLEKIKNAIKRPHGMILATGPTGSGKSTSLFAILNQLNNPEVNIMTLEDPVEYRVENIRQVQLNKKAGMTFASGLRSILRQDPDIVMVGEIRDSETASIATQSALTGHMVLSTVHTNDAPGAITRFIDMGIEPFLVSSVLSLVIAQRLVRNICPDCAEKVKPDRKRLEYLGIDRPITEFEVNFQKGSGCSSCMNTGFKGRTGIYEVLEIDDTIRQMIVQKKSALEIKNYAVSKGKLTTLKEDAAKKAALGITTVDEAISVVTE